jgi:hypothetical protein
MLSEERISEAPSLAPSNADSAVYDDGYLRVEHGKFYVA